jgi:hypothetical protein
MPRFIVLIALPALFVLGSILQSCGGGNAPSEAAAGQTSKSSLLPLKSCNSTSPHPNFQPGSYQPFEAGSYSAAVTLADGKHWMTVNKNGKQILKKPLKKCSGTKDAKRIFFVAEGENYGPGAWAFNALFGSCTTPFSMDVDMVTGESIFWIDESRDLSRRNRVVLAGNCKL